MDKFKSYEEFEQEFNENEPEQKLSPVEQARKNRILKVLNQRVGELKKYKNFTVKRQLGLFDLHMEEIRIVEELSFVGEVEGKPTNEVYQKYNEICLERGIHPMNQISFSQFVIKYFDYKIFDKKIKGKKYRIFQIDYEAKKDQEEWWR